MFLCGYLSPNLVLNSPPLGGIDRLLNQVELLIPQENKYIINFIEDLVYNLKTSPKSSDTTIITEVLLSYAAFGGLKL